MDDFEKLLAQLEADDPFYNLSSAERKQLKSRVLATLVLIAHTNRRTAELWQKWECAPSGSPWQKALCDEIDEVCKTCMDFGNATMAMLEEAKRKSRELGGGA